MAALTIGKVVFRAGIGIETVRFYEHRGLIDEPPRGFRSTKSRTCFRYGSNPNRHVQM
jgi:MerR family mercuric resistance operon transcriptional regulator